MRLFSALSATLLPTVLAVFQDEAWQVDYHHALLGLPQRHTTFFHRPQSSSKASLLYTLSEIGLLGAINPKDGTLVWRQKLQPGSQSNSSFLFPGDGQTLVVSGVDEQIASWSAIDGKQIWSVQHALPGVLIDLNSIEVDSSKGRKDVAALFQGESALVQRLDGKTGQPVWQYKDTRYALFCFHKIQAN
jgi:outer membrane protein assembly factor BamB